MLFAGVLTSLSARPAACYRHARAVYECAVAHARTLPFPAPAEAVAVLSALVLQEKRASAPSLTPTLETACDAALALALKVGAVQEAAGVPIATEDYVQNALRFGLVEVVHAWAQGAPFADICALTDVAEGTIVRAITRLDETCRELRAAARLCGDAALFAQMEAASAAIKRDLVFATSLYVAKA